MNLRAVGACVGLVFFSVVGGAVTSHVNDSPDTAAQYLKAWSFKDYDTMYSLSASTGNGSVGKEQFYRAAASLPAPASDIRIVSRTTRDAREHVYFESGSAVRGSIVVGPGGVEHPELAAAVSPSAGGPAGGGSSGITVNQLPANDVAVEPSRTIDGQTVDSILENMTKAAEAAETLHADVALHGSMMGQTVNEKGSLSFRAPNKFRMDFNSFTLNADGVHSILYISAANVYLSPKDLGDLDISPGIGMTGDDLKEKYTVALVGKGMVQGVKAFALSLKPPESNLTGLIGGGSMKLWVNAQTWLPMRAEMSSMRAEYTNMQVNAPGISDGTFVYTPPPNATELSLGALMGSLGSSGQ